MKTSFSCIFKKLLKASQALPSKISRTFGTFAKKEQKLENVKTKPFSTIFITTGKR